MIDRQQQRIVELERQLEDMQDVQDVISETAGQASHAWMKKLQECKNERDEYKQAYEHVKADRDTLVFRYANVEQFVNPSRFVLGENMQKMLADSNSKIRDHVVSIKTKEAPLRIAWFIVASKPNEDVHHYDTNHGMMQGDKSDFDGIVNRWRALAWQGPMPEDLQSPYLDSYGIDKNMQLRAIQALAPYWHENANPDIFFEEADKIFDNNLLPHIEKYNEVRTRKRFKQSAKKTYERVADNRNIESDVPYGQVGRNKKRNRICAIFSLKMRYAIDVSIGEAT